MVRRFGNKQSIFEEKRVGVKDKRTEQDQGGSYIETKFSSIQGKL